MKRIMGLIVVVILCLCPDAHARRIIIETNGFLSREIKTNALPQGSSFAVIATQNAENTIFDDEIKSKIEYLIAENGYRIESPDKADYFLTYTYGIDSGRSVSRTVPVFQSGSSTYHNIDSIEYTRKFKMTVIDANNYRNSKTESVAWIGDTTSSGSSSDLRYTIDYMLLSAFKWFGKGTGSAQKSNLGGWSGKKEVAKLQMAIGQHCDDKTQKLSAGKIVKCSRCDFEVDTTKHKKCPKCNYRVKASQ